MKLKYSKACIKHYNKCFQKNSFFKKLEMLQNDIIMYKLVI
jgi:hypothetical protein